jgi:hypothetical protein
MRIAVEVLSGELKKFSILERFHLVDEAWWHVHALPRSHFELLNRFGIDRIFDSHFKPTRPKKERFGFELMKMQ